MHFSQQVTLQSPPSVIVRALGSLNQRQVNCVYQVLAASVTEWTLDQHEDYDGYLSLMITPQGGDTTFVISGIVDSIHLSEFRDDELRPLGCFESIESTVRVLGLYLR